jgi:hypothetical protein
MVLNHALVLFPMTYPSVGSHHTDSILSLKESSLVLPSGRIVLANKLQKKR